MAAGVGHRGTVPSVGLEDRPVTRERDGAVVPAAPFALKAPQRADRVAMLTNISSIGRKHV